MPRTAQYVILSLTHWVTQITFLIDLWPLRHLIRVMRKHDLTNTNTMTLYSIRNSCFFLFFSNCFKCCEHSVNKSLSDNALTNILFPGFVSVPAYWKIWFAIISRTLVVHPEYMIEDRINHENILDLLELTFISWFPVIRLWGIPRYSVELEIYTYKVS